MGHTNVLRLLPVPGVMIDTARNKQQGAAPMYLWCFNLAKPSSLIGAKIGVTPEACFQYDIGGERVKLQVAHIKLSHSRAFLCARIPCSSRWSTEGGKQSGGLFEPRTGGAQ